MQNHLGQLTYCATSPLAPSAMFRHCQTPGSGYIPQSKSTTSGETQRVKSRVGRVKISSMFPKRVLMRPSKRMEDVVLLHSLADSLHLVEEGGEFVSGGITPGGIAPDIPQGSSVGCSARYPRHKCHHV